jgi:hypothetical protein
MSITVINEHDQESIELLHQIVVSFFSPQFKELVDSYQGDLESRPIAHNAIYEKLARRYKQRVHYSKDDLSDALEFCQHIYFMSGAKTLLPKQPDVLLHLRLDQYIALSHLVFKKIAVINKLTYNIKSTACLTIMWEAANYLIARSSLEFGLENDSLNKIFNQLVKTKPASFWLDGEPFNLLVHDRLELASPSTAKPIEYWESNAKYLSTHLVTRHGTLHSETYPMQYISYRL